MFLDVGFASTKAFKINYLELCNNDFVKEFKMSPFFLFSCLCCNVIYLVSNQFTLIISVEVPYSNIAKGSLCW